MVMTPALGPQCIASLYNFVGYGPANPQFVFIGPEEGSEGAIVNLQTRCTVFPATRHDRNQACRELAAGFNAQGRPHEAQRYLDALVPGTEPTWSLAARIVAALRQPPTAWQDEYRRLGALSGDTLLMELFPVPKPGTGSWPPGYAGIFGFPNQSAYYDGLWPRDVVPGTGTSARADLIASTLFGIPLTRSTYVFGYGRGGRRAEFWARFDRLFGVAGHWTSVIADVAEIARHTSGAVVARLAHPSRNGITAAAIPALIAAIRALPVPQ